MAANSLSAVSRIAAAKRKLKAIEKETWALLHVHENNKFLNYSSLLTKQVRNSYAAHAFVALQDTSLLYEIAHVCSLWDKPRKLLSEENSIPAITNLINHPEVIATLVSEANEHFGSSTGGRAVTGPRRKACEASLAFAVTFEKRVSGSPRLMRLRNFRDKFVAHRLSETRLEKRSGVPLTQYGDEGWLLYRTLVLYQKLELGVAHNSVDIVEQLRLVRHHTQCLWADAKFNIGG